MLNILTHDILPVFSMLALGFLLGRFGKISRDEATAINKVAFLILQPALIFPLIAGVDFRAFEFRALAVYAGCEVLAFALSFALARLVFRREVAEAWLLAMAVVFVNSLLYIWPISYLIYGEAAALPITAIVAWDSAVSFAFFIISADLIANRGAGGHAAARRVISNPVLIAIALGAAVNLAGISAPEPLLTAMDFAGGGAAPLTLFALGVILSGQKLVPTPTVAGFTTLKLLGFPALVWAALNLVEVAPNWDQLFLLNAAGPSGAMAFALALLYRVRTDAIAPVIIWTSLLSLISLAWLA
ncbi:AEC family transporter [Mameliella sp.]|uniref:AEC family transporter n=1 Tax=Mameliella sp. TaxID=1924940 RepID=UPI003BA8D786